ncbi:hypothetical protein DYB35_014041, partial [Aphanomyces astaci]
MTRPSCPTSKVRRRAIATRVTVVRYRSYLTLTYLCTHMKDLRRQELAVTSADMMQFLRLDHMAWIENYMATRKTGYLSLLRLLQHFANRHGFSKPRICRQKSPKMTAKPRGLLLARSSTRSTRMSTGDVSTMRMKPGCTMCPSTIWAIRGGGSYVANSESHSYRMTAFLTVRGDGFKLPILMVIRGEVGGGIETNEFDDYPAGHHYAMQKKAWMNGSVWKYYLREVLSQSIENLSILLVDNFDSH